MRSIDSESEEEGELDVENKENLGFPKGNNIGVAQAKG
jgi:GT2 family glycosyltransferase